VQRANNLAGFGIGYALAGPVGLGLPTLLKSDAASFGIMLGMYLNTASVLSKYASYYGPNASFTVDTLTFVPEYGGFNTRSCQPCKDAKGQNVIYTGGTSQKAFLAIEALYNAIAGGKPSLDFWLKQTYEDYTK